MTREGGELVVDTRANTTESCAQVTTRAVDALAAGDSFVLVADHDPTPLRYLLEAERSGLTSWQPVEEGPSRWRVRIRKAEQPA
jgi:uncharacterized protein (DUF2249 family)